MPAALARLNYIFFIPNLTAGSDGDFDKAVDDLVRALETDIPWIREHTRLGALAERWEARKRPSELLLRGAELHAAEAWLTTRPEKAPNPTDAHRALITLSRRAAIRRQRLTLAGSLIAAVVALALAGLAYWQRGVALEQEQVAEKQRQIATTNEREAIRQRDEVLLTQSRYLTDVSKQVTDQEHDPGTGLLLALEALRDEKSDDDSIRTRPYWAPAEVNLGHARRLLREQAVLGHADSVTSVAVTPDGSRIVTGLSGNTAKVWDAKTFALVGDLSLHGYKGFARVTVSPDGSRIVAGTDFGMTQVRDAKTFALLGAFEAGPVKSVAVTPDGSRILPALQTTRCGCGTRKPSSCSAS